MSLIKFLFVLLIIVPVAVVMIYVINNLNKDVRESSKNQERNKNTVKNTARNDSRREKYGKKPERRYAPEQADAGRGYSGDTGNSRQRQELGGSFGREIPGRDRYKQESPYYINKQKRAAGEAFNKTEKAKEPRRPKADRPKSKTKTKADSKRKRRKERKNKRKVREK